MDLGSLLLAIALFIVVAAFVARPLLERTSTATDAAAAGPADALLAEREQVLIALRDLDFDHTTDKIADEDYHPQRAGLVSRGVDVLRQLDRLGPDGASADNLDARIEAAVAARRRPATDVKRDVESAPAESLDARIEAAVAARRRPTKGAERKKASPALVCPSCGKPYRPGDKFCGRCGARLPVAAESR